MANDSSTLVISAFALFISFVSLYLSRLRGPSIKPIELEESKRAVLIDDSQHPGIDRLPFTLAVSVVNSGGTAGIVTNPTVSITPVDSLKLEPMQIVIQQTSMEPSARAFEQGSSFSSARAYSIPPYSVSVITVRCHLALMSLERIPSMHHFTRGCNLRQVYLAHFNSNKERMNMLISKLQRANTLGQLGVTIDCTEKTFPIFGPMKYKSKEFLSDAPLVYDASLVKQLGEKYEKLEFDSEYAVSIYLNLLNYLQQQSMPIIKMLKELNAESIVSYPTEIYDEQLIMARRILSIKDETFGQVLDELDKQSQTYKEILRILREKVHAQLTENDQLKIGKLKEALENALEHSRNLKAVILKEFQ